MGSHSSYSANLHTKQGGSYAGSRPASGLSKRRGPFRGPPPSFYKHGGYGRTGRTSAASGQGGHKSGASGRHNPGAAPDPEDPTAFVDRNPVSHFNARGHYRTQTAEDARRHERQSKARRVTVDEELLRTGGHSTLRFITVCGILVGTGLITGVFPLGR